MRKWLGAMTHWHRPPPLSPLSPPHHLVKFSLHPLPSPHFFLLPLSQLLFHILHTLVLVLFLVLVLLLFSISETMLSAESITGSKIVIASWLLLPSFTNQLFPIPTLLFFSFPSLPPTLCATSSSSPSSSSSPWSMIITPALPLLPRLYQPPSGWYRLLPSSKSLTVKIALNTARWPLLITLGKADK